MTFWQIIESKPMVFYSLLDWLFVMGTLIVLAIVFKAIGWIKRHVR